MENFSRIRNAVEGAAEQMAYKESLDKPEKMHYDSIFRFYKTMRGFEPEKLDTFIEISARAKKLSDETGSELSKIFTQVWTEKTQGSEEKVNEGVKQIKGDERLTKDEVIQKVLEFSETYLKEKSEDVKNDPRIISAFDGKDELLKKNIDFWSSSVNDVLKLYETSSPQLELLSWEELMEKLQMRKRGNLSAGERERKAQLERDKLPQGLFNKIIKFLRGEG